MTCRIGRELLQQQLDGETSGETLESHLGACAECATQRVAIQRLLLGLTLLVPPEPPADLTGRLTGQLVRAARQRQGQRRQRFAGFVGLAAAVLLVALGTWNWWPTNGAPAPEPSGEPVSVVTPPAPATQPLRESLAKASNAVASLSDRAATDTMEHTSTLKPLLPMPPEVGPLEPLAPPLEPLLEASEEVSRGLAPVADSAKRALNVFSDQWMVVSGQNPRHK